jgi:hypothetical protein
MIGYTLLNTLIKALDFWPSMGYKVNNNLMLENKYELEVKGLTIVNIYVL